MFFLKKCFRYHFFLTQQQTTKRIQRSTSKLIVANTFEQQRRIWSQMCPHLTPWKVPKRQKCDLHLRCKL